MPFEEFYVHFGTRPYFDGFQMIAIDELDADSICTNPKLHLPYVVAAAVHG